MYSITSLSEEVTGEWPPCLYPWAASSSLSPCPVEWESGWVSTWQPVKVNPAHAQNPELVFTAGWQLWWWIISTIWASLGLRTLRQIYCTITTACLLQPSHIPEGKNSFATRKETGNNICVKDPLHPLVIYSYNYSACEYCITWCNDWELRCSIKEWWCGAV